METIWTVIDHTLIALSAILIAVNVTRYHMTTHNVPMLCVLGLMLVFLSGGPSASGFHYVMFIWITAGFLVHGFYAWMEHMSQKHNHKGPSI
jgi:hypothetical protein